MSIISNEMKLLIQKESIKAFNEYFEKQGIHKHVKENDIHIVSRLMGGMSNFTFIIELEDTKYTFRIPGKNANNFVYRVEEKQNLKFTHLQYLTKKLIYLDNETGYMIASYIEGLPLHELNIENYIDKVAEILLTIHTSKEVAFKDYEPFERLNKYQSLVIQEGLEHDLQYTSLLDKLIESKDEMLSHSRTFCHGDSQPSNFIVNQEDNKIYITDWEFCATNDPYHDIACFGNIDFSLAEKLLPIYLKTQPRKEQWRRLYLCRTFQCLQWYNVALYKHAIGLSKNLNIPFDSVAIKYLEKATHVLDKATSCK